MTSDLSGNVRIVADLAMLCAPGRFRSHRLRHDSESSACDEDYRLTVLGAPSVGKTALCRAFTEGIKDGDDQKTKKGKNNAFDKWESIDNEPSFIKLYDIFLNLQNEIPGTAAIRTMVEKADGIVLVYSITDRESFRMVSKLFFVIHEYRDCNNMPLVLVGNKNDEEESRSVSVTEGRELAFDIGASFYETSAKLSLEVVQAVFHDVIRQVRCVRSRRRMEEQVCGGDSITRIKGLVHRLSFRSKKKQIQRKMST